MKVLNSNQNQFSYDKGNIIFKDFSNEDWETFRDFTFNYNDDGLVQDLYQVNLRGQKTEFITCSEDNNPLSWFVCYNINQKLFTIDLDSLIWGYLDFLDTQLMFEPDEKDIDLFNRIQQELIKFGTEDDLGKDLLLSIKEKIQNYQDNWEIFLVEENRIHIEHEFSSLATRYKYLSGETIKVYPDGITIDKFDK